MVAITGGPSLENHLIVTIVKMIGVSPVVVAVPLTDKLKTDDVVGAISAHLVARIWGALYLGIFGLGSLLSQLIRFVSIGLNKTWGYVVRLKETIGIRVDKEDETQGLDNTGCAMEAYTGVCSQISAFIVSRKTKAFALHKVDHRNAGELNFSGLFC